MNAALLRPEVAMTSQRCLLVLTVPGKSGILYVSDLTTAGPWVEGRRTLGHRSL